MIFSDGRDDEDEADGPVFVRDLMICNKKGLHARASARFVQCVDAFDARVMVSKDGQTVVGNSIMGLMMLAAGPGSTIRVTATGPEAGEAISAVVALVDGGFGET